MPGRSGTLNTAHTVGHTIFSTLYSVGKLDEKGMKNGQNLSLWMKNC
jgi:hypothetical protein